MTRPEQDLVIIRAVPRHCTEHGCVKCVARSQWFRRRAWRSRKSPARLRSGRK
jgi:hypothetical protein